MEQRMLTARSEEVELFREQVFKYLEQYMQDSTDVAYIISTKDSLIAKAKALGADANIIPNLFLLSGEHGKLSEVHPMDRGTICSFLAPYMNFRDLADVDPKSVIFAQEADRLAKLLIPAITEIAIAILMVSMAEIKLLKQLPNEERSDFLQELRMDGAWLQNPNKDNPIIYVRYETHRKKSAGLMLQIMNEANRPELLSATDKHIRCYPVISSNAWGPIPGNSISWEDLPTFIKNDILGNGGR